MIEKSKPPFQYNNPAGPESKGHDVFKCENVILDSENLENSDEEEKESSMGQPKNSSSKERKF